MINFQLKLLFMVRTKVYLIFYQLDNYRRIESLYLGTLNF